MSLRRTIIIEVKDDQFKRHKKSFNDYVKSSNSGVKGVGNSFSEMGNKINNALRNSNIQLGAFGRLLSGVAAIGTGLVSAVVSVFALVAVGITKATAEAIKFEKAMVSVQKTTGATDSELGILSDSILSLSKRLGTSKDELAAIAEVAGQLGIQGASNISAFTETVAKLSRVTELSAQEAGELVARIANIFDIAIEDSSRIGSVLNELSNTTTATAGKIASAITRVGSAGSSIGLTVDQVAGLSATLIDSGVVAERAGTALRNVFIRLQTQSEKLADTIGISKEEFDSLVSQDALGAINRYLDALRGLPPAVAAIQIKEAFGDENFLAVQTLTQQTDMLSKSLETSSNAFNENSSLNDEFGRTLESVSAKWQIFTNRINVATTAFGERFLPVLDRGLDSLIDFSEKFDTANETLLRVLKERGADPNRIQEIEIRINQDQIRDQLDRLKDQIASTEFGFRELGGFTSPLLEPIAEEFKNAEALSSDRLEELRARLEGVLEEFNRRSVEAESDFLSKANAQRASFVSDLIADIDGLINARSDVELLNEELKETDEELRKLRSGVVDSPAADIPGPRPTGSGSTTGDDQKIAKARKLLEDIQRANEIRNRASQEEAEALARVFKLQGEINELKEIGAQLGTDAVRTAIADAETRLRVAIGQLKEAEELQRVIMSASENLEALQGASVENPLSEAFESFGSDVDSVFDKIEQRADGTFRFTADVLKQIPEGVLDKFERLSNRPPERTMWEVAADSAETIANSIDDFLDLAFVFGGLSDEAFQFGDAISNAAKEFERLNRSILDNGGKLTFEAGFSGVTTFFSSAFQGLSALQSALSNNRDSMEELNQALRDNARSIRNAINDLINSGRIGENISGDEAQGIENAFEKFFNIRDKVGPVGGLESLFDADEASRFNELSGAFRNLLTSLADQGVDENLLQQITERFEIALQGGLSLSDAINLVLEDEDLGLANILETITGDLGGFSNTVGGAQEAVRFFSEFLGEEAPDSFRRFFDFLLQNVEGIPDDLRALFSEAAGLDVSTEEGRERAREIAETIARGIEDGMLDLGSLTTSEVEDILRTTLGLADSAESLAGSSSDGLNTTLQIQRSITQIQADLMLQILQEIAHWTRLAAQTLSGVDFSLPFDFSGSGINRGADTGSVPGSSTINNSFDISIQMADIEAIIRALETNVRERLNRVF